MPTLEQISAVMSHIGKMAKGVPKRLTQSERQRRVDRMKVMNAQRRQVGAVKQEEV